MQAVALARFARALDDRAHFHHRPSRQPLLELASLLGQVGRLLVSAGEIIVERRFLLGRTFRRGHGQDVANVLGHAQQRIAAGRGHQAEPPQRVLLPMILIEHQLQPRLFAAGQRLLEHEHDRVIPARLPADRPAGWLLAVDRGRGRKVVLGKVGVGLGNCQAIGLVELVVAGRRGVKLAEHEVAMLGASRAAAAQRIVRERREPEPGDAVEIRFGRDRDAIDVRILPGHQQRPVGELLDLGPGARFDFDQFHRVKCQRPFAPLGELGFPSRQPGEQFGPPLLEFRRQGGQLALGVAPFGVPAVEGFARQRHFAFDFIAIVEKREQPVILVVRDRIVLVRMALGAADRQPQPHGAGRGDAVENRLDAELLLVGAAFGVGERLAVKSGGQPLAGPRPVEQVAGQLLDRKTVERHVGVDRLDHPIAKPPGIRPRIVFLVAVGVGISGQVEPAPPPALAKVRRLEQPLDQPLIRPRRRVVDKSIDLFRLERQAHQVVRQPLGQRVTIGLGCRRQAAGFEPGQHEPVDRASRPRRVAHRRNRRTHDRLKRPMARLRVACRPGGARVDPADDRGHFAVGQRLGLRPGGRHALVVVRRADSPRQLALVALAGNQQGPRVAPLQGPVALVQPQARLLLVGPMTLEAVLGQNRQHLASKVDRLGLDGHGPRRDDRQAHRRGQADRRQACASPLSQQAVHHATPSQPNSRDTAHPSTPANRIADPRPGAKRPPAGSVVARRLRMASGKPARSQRREKRWIDGRVEKRWGDAAVRAGLAVDDVKTAAVDNRSRAQESRDGHRMR